MVNEHQGKPRISGVWIFILVIGGILILGDLNRRMADARRLDQDAQALETEVAILETESADLLTQVSEATSEIVVQEWAHEEGGMIQPGEVLVIPVAPSDAMPEVTPTPSPGLEQPSNWEVWWALLFGK
jgi:cell division protein FtsB